MHPESGWADGHDDVDSVALPPLPELPMGTRDVPASVHTRIDSPGARVRTPATRPPKRTRRPPVPPQSERADDRVGQTLGAYRLLELLGKGGMGFVYRAEHVSLGREVALKLLRADYAKRRDAVARFFQEARTVNRDPPPQHRRRHRLHRARGRHHLHHHGAPARARASASGRGAG